MKSYTVIREGITFDILRVGRDTVAIQCRVCLNISYNPNDVSREYCGSCHRFHSDMARDLGFPVGEKQGGAA